tara:strand:+ start:6037 stop:6330 length:294 start_codon:yes stop_codon:yes gene_type:complete
MSKEITYVLGAVVVVILGGVLFTTTPGAENEITGFSAFDELVQKELSFTSACYQCQDGTQVCDSENECRSEGELYAVGEALCSNHDGIEMVDPSGSC